MTPTNRNRLKDLQIEESRRKYPSLPEHCRSIKPLKDTDTNGLTRCVITWIELHGYQAERISSTGRYVDNRKVVTDVLGRKGMIGSGTWIPGNSTKGTADISATIRGRSVKIEIKRGKDRMSPWQHKYKEQIEAAGGIYIVVHTFDQFVAWWDETYNHAL